MSGDCGHGWLYEGKQEVARASEAIAEWHRRMAAVARAFKADLSKAREEG